MMLALGLRRDAGFGAFLLRTVRPIAQRWRSQTAAYIMSEGVNRGARFVLAVLIARHVGAAGFGDWAIALAIGTVLSNVGDLGLATETARALAARPDRLPSITRNLWVASPLSACVALALLAAFSLAMFGRDDRTLILLIGAGGVLESTSWLLLAPLRAAGRLKAEAAIRSLQGTTLLAAGAIVLLATGSASSVAWLFPVVGVLSVAVSAGALARHAGRHAPRADWTLIRQMLVRASPVLGTTLLFFVYFRLDVFMLSHMRGEEAAGLYGAAFNLAFGLAFVPLMFGRTMLARFAAAPDAAALRLAYRHALLLVALAGGAISLALCAFTPLLGPLYGGGFDGVRTPFLLLVAAQMLYLATNIHVELLFGRALGSQALALTACGLVLNFAINLALIPAFGPAGAATTMIITEAVLLGALIVYGRRVIGEAASEHVAGIGEAALTKAA